MSGRRMRSQNVQFQPALASAGVHTWVRWPPKKTRPRAPLTIACSAMNRSCCERREPRDDGGTARCERTTPVQAICSVIQNGFGPAACAITRAQSPTTVTVLFVAPPWMPGGYETG